MDVVDFLLPLAKILRYVRQEKACNAVFAPFVITWLLARHVLYLQLCYDIYNDVPGPDTMVFGCYSGSTYERLPNLPAQPDYFAHLLWPIQDAEGAICLNEVKWIFLGMLCFLQALSMIWICMILNVVGGILMGKKAEDTKSEDEGSDEDTVEEKDISRKKQMDVTDLNIWVSGNDEVSRLVSAHQ